MRGGNPISDAFMDHFAEHKDQLLNILRDACPAPKRDRFDDAEAWAQLERVALASLPGAAPRRSRDDVLAEGQRRLQPLLAHEPKDEAWVRGIERELKRINRSFDRQPHGRPKAIQRFIRPWRCWDTSTRRSLGSGRFSRRQSKRVRSPTEADTGPATPIVVVSLH